MFLLYGLIIFLSGCLGLVALAYILDFIYGFLKFLFYGCKFTTPKKPKCNNCAYLSVGTEWVGPEHSTTVIWCREKGSEINNSDSFCNSYTHRRTCFEDLFTGVYREAFLRKRAKRKANKEAKNKKYSHRVVSVLEMKKRQME